ncbi:BQ5605_C011g06428 [Microbotryum silenes-dioicae]|uniref:BQ5605_C011g06428 protein n=1 Tax=Microbotryum silenes-dioicae TaxID=796604 RepID=A0A2X0NRV7_9BASI|nr:BQ5605_C011g06428 [Microbotryum silenes-dioicae]
MLWNARLVDSAETSRTQTERRGLKGRHWAWLPGLESGQAQRGSASVMRLLQFLESVTIGGDRTDRTRDQLTPSQTQHSNLLFLWHRSLALSIGYAMFTYRNNLGCPNTRDGSVHQHVCAHLADAFAHFLTGVASTLQYQAASTASSVGPMNTFGFDASHIRFKKPAAQSAGLDSKHARLLFDWSFGAPENRVRLSHFAAWSGHVASWVVVPETPRTLEYVSTTRDDTQDAAACQEAYALSAGFSFGLIALASRTNAEAKPGEVHRDVEGSRHRKISSTTPHACWVNVHSVHVTEINVTSSAATMALALILGASITLARMFFRLRVVRTPVARAMILWNRIQLFKTWVDSHGDADLGIEKWSIVVGASFAIGLKFAGTAAAQAHGTLIHYLYRLAPPTRCPPSNEGVTYRTHLASHMAPALLCAGSDQYTLGTSNTAVAALGVPAFPPTPGENRSHLQAYRLLWAIYGSKVFETFLQVSSPRIYVRLHGIWFSDPTEAQALSAYLVHHHAPSFSVLKHLSRVARTIREIVGLRLRAMGKRLEARTGTPSWSDDFGKSLLEAWQ